VLAFQGAVQATRRLASHLRKAKDISGAEVETVFGVSLVNILLPSLQAMILKIMAFYFPIELQT